MVNITLSLVIRKLHVISVVIALILFTAACKPVIYKFSVQPLTAGPEDSIRVSWQVRGEATLLVHDHNQPGQGENGHLREFTLVVQKGSNEVHRKVQVIIVTEGLTDQVVFPTTLHGDTLVAAGIKDTLRWNGKFATGTVTDPDGRPLDIIHAGKQKHIESGTPPDSTFLGTPVSGSWELRSLLTPAEKVNHRIAPTRLSILITVKHQ